MLSQLSVLPYKRIVCGIFLLSLFLVYFYQSEDTILKYPIIFTVENNNPLNKSKYLVASSKCKIPDLDPFNPQAKPFYKPESYRSCRTLDLLTYVTKNDNIATLHIDSEIIPSYTKHNISCCYSTVTRKAQKKNPDDGIKISSCVGFSDNVTLQEDIVLVKCSESKTKTKIYENVHAPVLMKTDIQEKLEKLSNPNGISILFVGIDSISRLNFIRILPKTFEYVENNDWIPLRGYNKIDDNTFPNVMAILTGYNESRVYSICNPKKSNKLDLCPMLWYDYRSLGYVTAYAEDEAWINTFNYKKKGFTLPPTDYYFRPYILATEKLKIVRKDEMNYCTGPETAGERILSLARDFAITFKDHPKFGFFWMNTFSHNKINSPSGLDKKIRNFLEDLTNSGVLNTTIVVFLSDHGIRFGEIRYTTTGWLEERLPYIYISVPPDFKQKFPREFANLKMNSNQLTTPYDMHMTLQHLLILSGYNFTMKPSEACPSCVSLFTPIPEERSCEDASIEPHWCTCFGYTKIDASNATVRDGLDFVLNKIHELVQHKANCAKYSIYKVISASLSEQLTYKNDTYLILTFETSPNAIFEATVLVEDDGGFKLQGSISRLNSYNTHSYCTDDATLKKYCYCRG